MLPSLPLLKQIQRKVKNIPNHQGEYKRGTHYGLFLLCYGAGLRVSEAINFDLSAKEQNGLYRLNKTKGKKERFAYIPQQVISELKKHDWKPNNTNRFNFYHFLRKIKQEANLPTNIELTPHTLRRAFATYHAENGLSLPLLSKLLGHKSVRTTALYWINTYHPDDDDDRNTSAILCAKNWLEDQEKEPKQPQLAPSINEIPPQPARVIQLAENLRIEQAINQSLTDTLSECQQQLTNQQQQIAKLTTEKETLQNDLKELSEQNATLCQELSRTTADLTQAQQTIKQLTQELTTEQNKRIDAENNLAQQKQTISNLRQQLQTEREINASLKQKLSAYEHNLTNLKTAYHQALRDKEQTQKQLNQLTCEIKNFAKMLHQWQKLNYYQQNELKAQIVQPPPWKLK